MKLVWFISTLAAVASAAPAPEPSREAVTDELLFKITLPEFITRRDATDPKDLDWSSDSCSYSPDNPFGFPFDSGCKRHDFGYRNYKAQSRLNKANRETIDLKFKSDLEYLCESVRVKNVCRGLAKVYYRGVRAFGGQGEIRAKAAESEDLYKLYIEAQGEYEQLVKEAQANGELPILP